MYALGMRKCPKCETEKPTGDFSPTVSMCKVCDRARAKRHYYANRERYKAYEKARRAALTPEQRQEARDYRAAWAAKNPDKAKALRLRKYGLSLVDYKAKITAQDGRCIICREIPGPPGLVVDHNHETSQVRDLLCGPCNRGIGKFRENPDHMRAAALYVERWR